MEGFTWYPDSDDDLSSISKALNDVRDLRKLNNPTRVQANTLNVQSLVKPLVEDNLYLPLGSENSSIINAVTAPLSVTPTEKVAPPVTVSEMVATSVGTSEMASTSVDTSEMVGTSEKAVATSISESPSPVRKRAKRRTVPESPSNEEPDTEQTMLDTTLRRSSRQKQKQKQSTIRFAFNSKPTPEPEQDVISPSTGLLQHQPDPETYIELTAEQRRVFDMIIKERKNVFFTGAAGTGKSVLLRKVIRELKTMRKKWKHDGIAVTASTGLAACNIGGCTLHSFAGVGLGKEPVDVLVKRVKRNRTAVERWRRTKVLIIDEVSMIDAELFDKLEYVAREVRKSTVLFGGIQLVVTGDFFQLPPVMAEARNGEDIQFCFAANCWNEALDATVVLKQVHRQKDTRLSTMLNEMRQGQMSEDTIGAFYRLSRPLQTPDGISATHLYPRRYEVEQFNRKRLAQLQTPSLHFIANDENNAPDHLQSMYNCENLMAVKDLELKVGAQVMMIKNFDQQLVNGTLGKIVGFMDRQTFKIVEKYSDSSTLSSQDIMEQCQHGFEFDSVMDSEALSEMRSDPLYRKWCQLKETQTPVKLYPYVRFHFPDGQTRDHMILPEKWELEDLDGNVMCSREQIPLILAWALSIHKSQGQTLQWVHVDLTKTFEKGQAYVAVSRATSVNGLQVQGFRPEKVMVHDKVVDFYNNLQDVSCEAATTNKQEDDVVQETKPSTINHTTRQPLLEVNRNS